MPTLQVDQLLFSRVEAEYSPEKRSGYQVVFSTCSSEESREIEKRLQCFRAEDDSLARYQYFWLSTGRIVITHTRVISGETDREITDRSGRPGAFLAHALVMSGENFRTIGFNPFVIIDQHEDNSIFVTDVQEMVRVQQANTKCTLQNLPSSTLQKDIPDEERFSKEELSKLFLVGHDAQEILENKQSVMMQSDDPSSILDWVRMIFYGLEADRRWFCTFDTYADGCMPATGDYWLVGGQRRNTSSKLIQVKLDSGKVEYKKIEGGLDQDPKAGRYYPWLRSTLQNFGLAEIKRHASTVQQIVVAFEQGQPLPQGLDNAGLESYHSVYAADIQARLQSVLAQHIGANAAAVVPLLEQKYPLNSRLSIAAVGHLEAKVAAKFVYEWLLNTGPQAVTDWWALYKFAQKAEYTPLLLVTSVWAHQPLNPLRHTQRTKQKALTLLQQQGFSRVLQDTVSQKLLNLEVFITSENAVEVTNQLAHSRELLKGLDEKALVKALTLLIQHGAGAALENLTPLVSELQDVRGVRMLIKVLDKNKDAAPYFAQALAQQLGKLTS